MDLSSVRNAIERYARAVQEADVEELRRITFGVLREQLSLEKTRLIVAQLAADTCQHGAISVRDFRDAYFDASSAQTLCPAIRVDHWRPFTGNPRCRFSGQALMLSWSRWQTASVSIANTLLWPQQPREPIDARRQHGRRASRRSGPLG